MKVLHGLLPFQMSRKMEPTAAIATTRLSGLIFIKHFDTSIVEGSVHHCSKLVTCYPQR